MPMEETVKTDERSASEPVVANSTAVDAQAMTSASVTNSAKETAVQTAPVNYTLRRLAAGSVSLVIGISLEYVDYLLTKDIGRTYIPYGDFLWRSKLGSGAFAFGLLFIAFGVIALMPAPIARWLRRAMHGNRRPRHHKSE